MHLQESLKRWHIHNIMHTGNAVHNLTLNRDSSEEVFSFANDKAFGLYVGMNLLAGHLLVTR